MTMIINVRQSLSQEGNMQC